MPFYTSSYVLGSARMGGGLTHQKKSHDWLSSNDSRLYFCINATRNTLVAANSQQRPLLLWLVMGPPSKGMRTLKTCWSAIFVAREVSTSRGLAADSAERASLCDRSEDVSIWLCYRSLGPSRCV